MKNKLKNIFFSRQTMGLIAAFLAAFVAAFAHFYVLLQTNRNENGRALRAGSYQ